MLKRDLIFKAMLALREFTSHDVAVASGVSETTVRTVMGRCEALLEDHGVRPTGRRGGSYVVRRLKPEGVAWLRGQLDDASQEPPAPASLVAAEEMLMQGLLKEEDIDARRDIVHRARALVKDAEFESAPLDVRRVEAINWLLQLSASEVGESAADWTDLIVDLLSRLELFDTIDDGAFSAALLRRATKSSRANDQSARLLESMYFGSLKQGIFEGLLDISGMASRSNDVNVEGVDVVEDADQPDVTNARVMQALLGLLDLCKQKKRSLRIELCPRSVDALSTPSVEQFDTDLAIPGFRLRVALAPAVESSDPISAARAKVPDDARGEADMLWLGTTDKLDPRVTAFDRHWGKITGARDEISISAIHGAYADLTPNAENEDVVTSPLMSL